MSLLSEWRQSVLDATRSPWPGPRPMKEGRYSARELIGRADDVTKFKRLLFDTDVVVFTGSSGVGKTSMLQVGLIPELRESGYTVVVCNKWSRSDEIAAIARDGGDPASKADRLLRALLGDKIPVRARLALADGGDLLAALNTYYRDRCVVVLDQFEELMRYQPDAFQWLLRWIENAASQTKIRIVVSLRVEYEHQLNGSGGLRLGPFSQKRYELQPIFDPKHIKEIIEAPNALGNGEFDLPVVSSDASTRIVAVWTMAGEEIETGRATPQDRGLLHLQALLLVLWTRAGGRCIEVADIDDQFPQVNGAALLKSALAEAVAVSADKCIEACATVGVPDVLAARTKHYVRAISAHLSSGGFKVDHAREDLAHLVVFPDSLSDVSSEARGQAEPARLTLAALVDESMMDGATSDAKPDIDWITVQRRELLNGADLTPDTDELTGGVLLGRSPVESLLEEYRAYYFAIEWLRLCELIRITTPEADKTMVSLIHDLFGDGLIRWSSAAIGHRSGVTAEDAINQFSALRGVRMSWKNETDAKQLQETRLLVNLRWKYCDVGADFKDLTFVNCDFQGTVFRECAFSGVQFVNCTLDDVEFIDCAVVGSPTLMPTSADYPCEQRGQLGTQPSFLLMPDTVTESDSLRTVLRSLSWYAEPRKQLTPKSSLYSFTAGLAARPSTEFDSERGLSFETHSGGLTMLGGRLSSLKVRNCDFGPDGWMSLRQVAGTSVEFAEQTHLRLETFDTAIRGLTITRPVDASEPTETDAFRLALRMSAFVNTWFGVGLTGTAVFDDCMVLEMFNAADQPGADGERAPGFEVTLPNSSNFGVVNAVATPDDLEELERPDDAKRSLGAMRTIVNEISNKIDYRRHPALFELHAASVAVKPDTGEDA